MPQKNHTPIDRLIQEHQAISNPAKEAAPMSTKPVETMPIHEVVEHKIEDQEVSPHVDVRPEKVDVPPDLQQMGVQAVSQQPTFPTLQTIHIPLADDKVYSGLHEPIYSSWRWLAELCRYLLEQGHAKLKNIHGKITRVKK